MKIKQSLAQRNIIILILSILPFFAGIGISVYQSSDTEYLSAAINVSGSQRMRTMLISNYVQAYVDAYDQENTENIELYKSILTKETNIYQEYYYALINGNKELGLKANEFQEIKTRIQSFQDEYSIYVSNTIDVLEHPTHTHHAKYVIAHSLEIKNNFHDVTGLFQEINDDIIHSQKLIDIMLISFGAFITIIGIFFSLKIRQKEYHANFDYLTKLKNRHSLFEDIESLDIRKCSLLFIDLNKFKNINDTFGHQIGDEILFNVSKRLGDVFGFDHLYRYGGDEFIVILVHPEGTFVEEAVDVKINEIWRVFSKAIVDSHQRDHYIGLSMGVVLSEAQVSNWDTLINLADDLMYDSKIVSGHVIMCSTKEDIAKRSYLNEIIDEVFTSKSIHLKYSPVYNLCKNNIYLYHVTSSLEYNGEVLDAKTFLPILKRKGYLREVDKYILTEIETNYHSLNEKLGDGLHSIRISINFSENTLRHLKTNGILEILSNLQIPNNTIVVKVSESLLQDKSIQLALEMLKSSGVMLAVDNVILDISIKKNGIYKNIDIIKIGHKLSKALTEKNQTRAIMIEFIKMFNSIGKIVIIEGVDETTHDKLIEELCIDDTLPNILCSQKII